MNLNSLICKGSLIIAVALFVVATSAYASETEGLTAATIVNKSNLASYYAGTDGRSDARMKIVDSQDRVQYRQFVMLRKNQQENMKQHFLVVFSRPTDVRDTVFLVDKKPQSDDDRWLYLPGLDLVKRISSGDKRTSFVGSHFYYEDVSGRSPLLDNHELINQDEENYYLKHTPKSPNTVEFAYYTSTINKQTFLPMHVIYYDNNDKPLRTMEVNQVKIIESFPTVTEATLTDHRLNGHTLIQFRFMDYNLGIPEQVFSERSLRNPPDKWLQRTQ